MSGPDDDQVPLDELAYDQVNRALEQQVGVLNELRQRTSTLVAVTALVATFLGGQGLRANADDQGPAAVLALALLALFAGIGASLWVLAVTGMRKRKEKTTGPRPHPHDVVALAFTLNVEVMLDHAKDRGLSMPNTTRMEAARSLQLAWDENASIIGRKQLAFNLACVALGVQTASWITFIALGREVI